MRKLTFLTALLAWCVSWGQQEARFQTTDVATATTVTVRSSAACAVGSYSDRASFDAEAGADDCPPGGIGTTVGSTAASSRSFPESMF